ncbi:MAG TPA: metal ABC transporter permease [Planctomycetaceae bacterium]|nr:metal ABC transporter permease [Planctomycetaceae bacterium]
MTDLFRLLTLQDYNTRIVLTGTALLGIASGVVGTLMLLRRRALIGDVASHAALPGVGVAYLVMERFHPGSGKWYPGLILGAALSAVAGLVVSQMLRRIRRIKEDAALALTLSLFFGLGVALFTMIQGLPSGQAAGLSEFVFGKPAAIVASDVQLLAVACFVVLLICGVCHKEFALLCFDQEYALAGGWPVGALDLLLTALVVGVTVLAMQSVGLLLVVALLVLPPTSARFWTDRLGPMQFVAAACGGVTAALGVLLSAAFPHLATGAVIVLMGTVGFVVSLLFGTRRGVVWRLRDQWRLQRRIGLDDLLRGIYELLEQNLVVNDDLAAWPVDVAALERTRHWSQGRFPGLLQRAQYEGLLRSDAHGQWRLTAAGRREALLAVRRHRLWELYLIHFADIAPTSVDRSADAIEHWLQPDLLEQLETLLVQRHPQLAVPVNPHEGAAT